MLERQAAEARVLCCQGEGRAKRALLHVLAADDRGHAYLDACLPSDLASETLLDQVGSESRF